MTIQETVEILLDHRLECDVQDIEAWIKQGKIKATKEGNTIEIEEIWDFLNQLRLKGTAYEKGIDDKTKIERLEKEIGDLKARIDALVDEKILLEIELGTSPFN
jgi:hypothetical protein